MSKINHIADLINVDAVSPETMGPYDKVAFFAWSIGVAVANTHAATDDVDWDGYADIVEQLDKVKNELARLSVVIQASRERAVEAIAAGKELSTTPW